MEPTVYERYWNTIDIDIQMSLRAIYLYIYINISLVFVYVAIASILFLTYLRLDGAFSPAITVEFKLDRTMAKIHS